MSSTYHGHFDCFSGAAGDMLLSSCLDASGNPIELAKHVSKCISMGMPELAGEFEIQTKRVWRGGMGSIAGLHVTVLSKYHHESAPVPKRKTDDDDDQLHHHHSHQHDHQHSSHQHSNVGDHDHSHDHAHDHNSHSHDHSSSSTTKGPLRNLREIKMLIENSSDEFIDPWVKTMAILTFTELAHAEATTHGAESIESVHFHEVGAIDSIVDTVGTLIALHYLNVKSFSCSRLPIGEGQVWTDHGILPVPAPATLRLLVDMPTCHGPLGVITGELVTPTGAALLRALTLKYPRGIDAKETSTTTASSSSSSSSSSATTTTTTTTAKNNYKGRPPNFTIRKIGIGAGTKDFEKHPNILRLLLGDDIVT
jgi:uncharacterized protein (DUF111 family)